MSTPRDIRRLAFTALFQFDARGDQDIELVRATLDPDNAFSEKEKDAAIVLALAAHAEHRHADNAVRLLAPTWPAHRQPAADRAILRLAHYEMTVAGIDPRIVVNEAVELAKEFSTERSPSFINGVLDKILKQVQQRAANAVGLPTPPQSKP